MKNFTKYRAFYEIDYTARALPLEKNSRFLLSAYIEITILGAAFCFSK
jgi:hypothetical protein